MKKFSKLIAVVLAIAVIICPMMSVVSHATTTNGYKIEANPNDANELMLTISSTDGFVAYDATVTFNGSSAFQSTYDTGDYDNGLRLISYEVDGGEGDSHNLPTIHSSTPNATTLRLIIIKDDFTAKGMYTELVIGIRVAAGSTATLTKIQAADEGTVAEDPTLLTFPAANESTGEINQNDEYAKENATTVHTHNLTLVPAKDATCTAAGNSAYYTCSGCDKIFSDSEGTEEIQDATIPALGHNMTHHPAVESTCKVKGNIEYYSCSRCKKNFAEETGITELTAVEKELAAHTQADPVVEHEVAATCTAQGSYDSVVYCSVCGDEISRETVVVPTTKHTPATAVEENRVEPTCGVDGHYDSVVYCSECDAEISRTQHTIPATGAHTYTYTSNGDGTHTVGCANCDYSAQEACDTEGTDGACSKCGYKAATGPVFDASLSAAFTKKVLGISDTFKSETIVLLKNFPANYTFDSFVVTKKILTAPSYTYTSDVAEYVFGTETCTNTKNRAYKITFSNVGLYELGTKLEYKLLVNEGGTLCYYSWEESIVDLAVEYYEGRSTLTPTKEGKDLVADILKVAETARLYFANVATNAGYSDNSLANMSPLNSAIDYENYGTKDYGELPAAVSKPTGVTRAVLGLLASPSFGITMLAPNKADRASWTPESVTVTCSYFSKAENKQITEEILGTDPDTSKIEVKSTGAVVLSYSGVKLYDADKVVTITASNGTTEYTYTASILSMISPMIDNVGLDGDVYRAIACFNASAHVFWPTY